MKVINLQDEHKLFNKNSEVDLKVGYHGCGLAFLKKSLDEPLKYCEDLSQGETIKYFNNQNKYYIGKCSCWEFIPSSAYDSGSIAIFFSKYWKNGYFEEPIEEY